MNQKSPEMLADAIEDLQAKVNAHDEVLNGSPTARHTGLTQRFDRVEAQVQDANLQGLRDDILILKDNAIPNGRTKLEVVERDLARLNRFVWTIGSSVALAIVSALVGLVLNN